MHVDNPNWYKMCFKQCQLSIYTLNNNQMNENFLILLHPNCSDYGKKSGGCILKKNVQSNVNY